MASINSFVNNLEMIENLILNQLAIRKLAPYRLIKKRAGGGSTLAGGGGGKLGREGGVGLLT